MQAEVDAQKDTIRELERRLLALKWKKSENSNKLGIKLYSTKGGSANSHVSESGGEQKSKWLKSVIDSELSQPLSSSTKVSADEMRRLENEQRKEYLRFDTHLAAIRNSARKSARRKKKKKSESSPLQTQSRRLKELEVRFIIESVFFLLCFCFHVESIYILFSSSGVFVARERSAR